MEDMKLNFRSKYDYIKSLQDNFGLNDEECNGFLWILSMWDAKKQLPEPTEFKLNNQSLTPNTKTK
jgi:hypothetical protein